MNSNWPLFQLDIKNAFVNGGLEEEVFMSLPLGFKEKLRIGKVCRLKKSLYGLKQSPRAWFECFDKAVRRYGFIKVKQITLYSTNIQKQVKLPS